MYKRREVTQDVLALRTTIQEDIKVLDIKDGIVVVGSENQRSALVSSNKNAEKAIVDLKNSLVNLVPSKLEYLTNDDPKYTSSASKASILGSSFTIVIQDGQLLLGDQQEVYHLNFNNEVSHLNYNYYI